MKVFFFIMFLSICWAGYKTSNNEIIDPYHPKRPSDIPEATCHGTPINWDWEKQRAYNQKKLFLHKDSTGCVLAVIIKIK